MNNQTAQTMPELPAPFDVIEQADRYTFVYTAAQMHQYARDYAAALSQSAGVADGWKLVPRRPTEAMFRAANECASPDLYIEWLAMLDAAPQPPTITAGVGHHVLCHRIVSRNNIGMATGWFNGDITEDERKYWESSGHMIETAYAMLAAAPPASGGEYPGCSGDPASCPENEGHGCCKPNPARHVAIVCDWKNADPFPTFIEAEIGGKSVSLEWRDRPDGLKELIVPVTAAPQPPSAASVSERARELLAAQFSQNDTRRETLLLGRNVGDPTIRRALRALEQALTQQRGECYCQSCKGSGEVIGLHASPSGDPQDAYEAPMACPKCDGTGDAK